VAGRVEGKVALITGGASGLGAESARRLAREGAAVLLTDMTRGEDRAAGRKLMPELEQAHLEPPIIFYVTDPKHTKPDKAFGITVRPDELFHLITDALERQRG